VFGGDEVPDPRALTEALELARQVLDVQEADELRQVMPPAELAEDIAQARRHRQDLRRQKDLDHAAKIRQMEAERRDRVAAQDEERRHRARLDTARRRHEHRVQRAQHLREKLLDPTNALVKIRFGLRTAPWLALVPAGVATVVGTLNVGTQMQRITGATGPAVIVGYGIELLFTLPLVAILITQICGATPIARTLRDLRAQRFIWPELILLLVAIALNVGTHWVPSAPGQPPAEDPTAALIYLGVPAGLAFSMWLAPQLLDSLTIQFAQAAREAQLVAPAGVFNGEEARLLRLVRWVADQDRRGQIPGERDEHGLPSVTGVAKAVREYYGSCSKPFARELLDAYAILSGVVD